MVKAICLSRVTKQKQGDVEVVPPEAETVTHPANHKNWRLAFVLLLVDVILVVASSQLTSSTFNDPRYKPYQAPFLFVWCKVAVRALAFPVVVLPIWMLSLLGKKKDTFHNLWKHCTEPYRDEGSTESPIRAKILLRKFAPMCTAILALQVTWVVGHVYAPSSIIAALGSSAVAFAYILSWLLLKNQMLIVKGFFVLVGFVGIGMISYASTVLAPTIVSASQLTESTDTVHLNETLTSQISGLSILPTTFDPSSIYIGVVCGLIGAVSVSAHMLAFKKAFRDVDLVQVSLIITLVSVFICTAYLPVPIILNVIGMEPWNLPAMPWGTMIVSWITALFSAMCYIQGLSLSNPFFMSLAEVAIVAMNTGVDSIARGIQMSSLQIAGTVVVAVAFVFMIMPDEWLSLNLKKRKLAIYIIGGKLRYLTGGKASK
ncbi:hypothetical protein RvY_16670 [Ramazzottius varieornatus]|uniref:EamA domain-containing protein n=1 Tax=Ramazzottius varieornatus TaxID=947166 RepID=A0A1D1VZC4_RAMVA|nr:hypothetical protein RvY_16670 [Ramazzottius varieornatus]